MERYQKIRAAMDAARITPGTLAGRTGIPLEAVARYISGMRPIPPADYKAICSALWIKADKEEDKTE